MANRFFGEKTFLLDEEIDKIFMMVDTNNNGAIDYSEFIASAANLNHLMSEQQLNAAFKALDQDGSGEISFQEFSEVFTAGLDIGKEELMSVFESIDTGKNGLINQEEFKTFVKRIFH